LRLCPSVDRGGNRRASDLATWLLSRAMHATVRCRIIVVLDLALCHYYAHSHELPSIAKSVIKGGLELLLEFAGDTEGSLGFR
jgi:hypothetical protein